MLQKSKKYELFGWPVFLPHRLTRAQQVYDILCREIQSKRWQQGEKLPSIGELANESGIGQRPIRQAYEQLREEGYVRQQGRKGTTLIRLTPDGVKPQQVIGVVVERMSLSEGTIISTGRDTLYLHTILESALKHHYVTQVLSLPSDYDWDSVNKRSGPFNHNVQGIISLREFPTVLPQSEDEDRIPVVFITEQRRIGKQSNWEAQPMVTGDFYSGFYELTKRVLSFGHRNIAFFADSTRHPFYLEVCWWGYERALREAGLPSNRDSYEKSLTLEPLELASAKEFLDLYSNATAIICENLRTAQNIIAIADMQGISVPQDLSVVAQGYGPMQPGKDKKMTCLQYDIPRAVEICFDLLMEQLKTRTCSIRQTRVRPIIFDGESLAPPTS